MLGTVVAEEAETLLSGWRSRFASHRQMHSRLELTSILDTYGRGPTSDSRTSYMTFFPQEASLHKPSITPISSLD